MFPYRHEEWSFRLPVSHTCNRVPHQGGVDHYWDREPLSSVGHLDLE